eukprot:CAMPEP_0172773002 /NCGR_PEP_ID=MMETSP1074-20121228/193493_1 /TAXON_ID=2916 /ORGANISM="Ceratium fusus, Strain PA161109" /LENGTH=85 /DNA_ID=CAMNT_0013609215 /DNA_START=110 /DNA_END=367 /DNA_ORIENTATION=+
MTLHGGTAALRPQVPKFHSSVPRTGHHHLVIQPRHAKHLKVVASQCQDLRLPRHIPQLELAILQAARNTACADSRNAMDLATAVC